MMYVEFMKNFLLADSSEQMAVGLMLDVLSKKTFYSYFQEMMFVEFMKNSLLADSGEQIPVRLIPTF